MMDSNFYKKILVEQKYITEEDAARAEAYEKEGGGSFVDLLLKEELVSQETLGYAIAEYHKVRFIDLRQRHIDSNLLTLIPAALAREHRIVPVSEKDGELLFATDMVDSLQPPAEFFELFAPKKVTVGYALTQPIDAALAEYSETLDTRFSEILLQTSGVAPQLFEEIIRDALVYQASDVHFEPRAGKADIRFRVDGMLELAGSVESETYANILNRIKILSNLRIDEHFLPQDGAVRFELDGRTVDLRVSVVPTLSGEKTVIRVLAEYVRDLSFADLGFTDAHTEMLTAAAHKPFGMILVSGPTGSGKTTTLYSLVRTVKSPKLNIMTIEDPVEYRMTGTNQMQVHEKAGLTFARGLRAILRQDPNVVLVGEIRDLETAETAINAALTGHLLFSTFHANNAATCVPRLLEMDVEPFLLASTLELIVAQRLVRRICESCRESYKTTPKALAHMPKEAFRSLPKKSITLYRGKGCSVCHQTGYRGRAAVVEMISMTPELKALISQNPAAADIWDIARQQGSVSMFDDGVLKAGLGITTLDEVVRVTSPYEGEHHPE